MTLSETEELLQPVRDLLRQEEPQLALDKLNFLVHAHTFAPEAQWLIYDHYATCYLKLVDLLRWRQYAWASITAATGQPRGQQQTNFSDYLFMLHYFPDVSDAELSQQHFLYQQFADATPKFRHPLSRHQHEKLRIGYLASMFSENVVSLFSIQLLAAYDRERFEVYTYSTRAREDQLTEFLQPYVKKMTVFQPGQTAEERAQMIYDDEIDILFDLEVHAGGGLTMMLMCAKPAPVQVAGIGYMSTSGTDVVDAFLGDPYCDPPGLHDGEFREKIWRLPHSHFCYTPSERVLRCEERPYVPHTPIVFGSFNNVFKITDEMLGAWREILARVPESRMLIKNSSHRTGALPHLRRQLQDAGMPMDRIETEDATGEYLQRYADVDIMLDTYPYTGGGTTCESLYMGVPIIARYGRRHGNRFSYSIMQNVGVGDLCCATLQEYVEKAVALAQDRELLTALHQQLRSMMQHSPVMAAGAYVRDVEAGYERLWQQWLTRAQAGKQA